jgi:cytochrome c
MKTKILEQIKLIKEKIAQILNNESLRENFKHTSKAIGVSLAIILIVILATNILYQGKPVKKRGYIAEITEQKPILNINKKLASGDLPSLGLANKIDIAKMIANANIDKGKKTFKKCAACHTIEKGAANKIGPNLYNIVGKRKAANSGFKYSENMAKKGGRWSYKELNVFLKKPNKYIPKTKMTFAGLKKDKDRANIIAYLEQFAK